MRLPNSSTVSKLVLVLLAAGCRSPARPAEVDARLEHRTRLAEIEALFRDRGVSGCIRVREPGGDLDVSHNPQWVKRAYIPASTFKVFHSLVALETGVVQSVDETIPWDGVKRSVRAWNQDANLRRGMRYSVVWAYQLLARRIGEERMQRYLDEVGYGNRTIGAPIDRFWLEGPIRITPDQQIDFLTRLHGDALPFSRQHMAAVREIMVRAETNEYVVRAKTGWGLSAKIGWYVGWVETKRTRRVVFFALNLQLEDAADARARVEITMRTLRLLGVI